ncbi:proline racemase family protein [Hyphococcus flavus]|uniref:Proline racemase family protein n=1 Tax=Hyphococcus flavus TaxID=1866326 RepID=A0AAE9ZCV7_9PROT|nr:proline racemase family protein [Hyphococcus flavus]WDI30122.1 proline racemase family protein [Hyphococcus flavus]
MRSDRVIHVVGCHAEGEVGDVVVGGVKLPEAETLWEQSRILARDRTLKDFLLNEPRGGVFRHINILTTPKNPEADIANIILEPETVPPMSGSNTICVVTVVLETGIFPMQEPVTHLKLEMPGGLIDVRATCRAGKVESVEFKNIASFADRLDFPLELNGHGTVSVDILFGGDSFVTVDAASLGLSLAPDEARDLAALGMEISRAASEQIGFQHPTLNEMNEITFCLLTNPAQMEEGCVTAKHTVAIKPGKIDRSPTGTAVSARLAQMHARGQAKVGDEVVFKSILDSKFIGRIEHETETGGKPAIIPSVSGRAWLTGTYQLMLDPSDPWPTGYRVNDTWPSLKI